MRLTVLGKCSDSPSPLEKGVALFNRGGFEKAMEEFDRVENTTESPEMKSEAGYRKALCLVERKREEEAKPIFDRLAADQGPLQTRAACQVWKILLRSAKVSDIEQADKIFDNLNANVDYTDLALVLSEEERNEILSFYRQVGFFGRIVFNPNRVRNLERALKIEELIKADHVTRQRTLWRLADAFRLDGRDTDAVGTIEKLLSAEDLLPDDRIGITRDYAWLMITGGTPGKALEEINRRLGPAPPGPEDVNFPMLVERARVHAALRNWDQAEADVVRFLELVRKPSISYSDFAEACLFRGFLLERRGLKDEAVKVWRGPPQELAKGPSRHLRPESPPRRKAPARQQPVASALCDARVPHSGTRGRRVQSCLQGSHGSRRFHVLPDRQVF